MPDITAAMVKQLRDKTNAAMMKCKAALIEADGDLEQAETILRKKGIEGASKKAARATQEGVIASKIQPEGKVGVLVEVNCETDFVAKNDNFRDFVDSLVNHLATSSQANTVEELFSESIDGQSIEEIIKAKIAEIGENIVIRRFQRFNLDGSGVVASYIHLQGKVGVLLETECDASIESNPALAETVKDITLHIAAAHPVCISRDEIDAARVEREREIYRDQVKDKPENIIDRIVEGKLDKYFSSVCLLEQGFIKDPDQPIGELIAAKQKELGGDISVSRFVRYAIGDDPGDA